MEGLPGETGYDGPYGRSGESGLKGVYGGYGEKGSRVRTMEFKLIDCHRYFIDYFNVCRVIKENKDIVDPVV